MEKRIDELMKMLDCPREDVLQMLEDDKKIDKGDKLFQLSAELEKGAKKARQADRKVTVYDFKTRERKADNDKAELVEILAESLRQLEIIPTVTNKEREMEFVYKGRKFKIVLSAPRK